MFPLIRTFYGIVPWLSSLIEHTNGNVYQLNAKIFIVKLSNGCEKCMGTSSVVLHLFCCFFVLCFVLLFRLFRRTFNRCCQTCCFFNLSHTTSGNKLFVSQLNSRILKILPRKSIEKFQQLSSFACELNSRAWHSDFNIFVFLFFILLKNKQLALFYATLKFTARFSFHITFFHECRWHRAVHFILINLTSIALIFHCFLSISSFFRSLFRYFLEYGVWVFIVLNFFELPTFNDQFFSALEYSSDFIAHKTKITLNSFVYFIDGNFQFEYVINTFFLLLRYYLKTKCDAQTE